MDFKPNEMMRIHRTRKNLTQEALAKKIGTFQVRVSRLELNLLEPTPEEIIKIEEVLGVSIWSHIKGDVVNEI